MCFSRVFDVFPANQSGNAVLLGIGLGRASAVEAWRPAIAILGFGIGVALGIVLGRRVGRPWRAELLVVLELALLAPIAFVVLEVAHPRPELDDVAAAVLLVMTSIAMGLQTEVIGRVAGVGVATTYQSGAIARIAEVAAEPAGTDGPPGRASLLVLGTVLAAYIAGAALGAALGSWAGALLVPIGILVALAALLTWRGGRSELVA